MSRSVSWMQMLDEETLVNIKLACALTGLTMKEFVRIAIIEKIQSLPPHILANGGFDFRLYTRNYTYLRGTTQLPDIEKELP